MALSDEVFPSKRDERLVQAQWADDWLDGAAGFGYAAECLTQHVNEFGARIDQAGLAIFIRQRHRVEMTLKGLLDRFGADVPNSHSLRHLWDKCKSVLEPKDPSAWKAFVGKHDELVKVLDRKDRSSYTFRYPVNAKGIKVTRPAFIDLAVLHEHVEALYFGAAGYIDYFTENNDCAAWEDPSV